MSDTASPDSWLVTACRGDIVRRSVKISLLVGTLLALINHGDSLFGPGPDAAAMLKIGLTYLVPYGVATWSAVQTARSNTV